MGDVGSFIGHVLWNFWTVVAGFMISIEPAARFLWHGYDAWAERWLSADFRKRAARVGALLAFIVANYLAFHNVSEQLREAQQQTRASTSWQLTPAQRAALSSGLRLALGETHTLEINSAPSCETCEEFAQELREFIGNIPGWTTQGSTLVFSMPFRRGLKIFTRPDERNQPFVVKLISTFESAGLPLPSDAAENMTPGSVIIVVGRRER